MTLRTVQIGGLRLVASRLDQPSWLVRVHPDDGAHYDRMIVVTEKDDGRALYLSGWIGEPLTPKQWREARNELFPNAECITFERLDESGMLKRKALHLGEFARGVAWLMPLSVLLWAGIV